MGRSRRLITTELKVGKPTSTPGLNFLYFVGHPGTFRMHAILGQVDTVVAHSPDEEQTGPTESCALMCSPSALLS